MPGAPPLAQPSFFTGPNDQLAVANPYTASGGVINAIKDEISSLGISIPDVLKGGKALASLLPIVTGIKNGQLLTNPVGLISRLLASSSQITSAFKLLGPDLQGELLAGMKTLGPVAVTLGGLTQVVKTTNFNNLNSVGNLINSFTNGAAGLGIVDKDSIASVIGGIVKQAGGYGITGAYGAIMTGINDVDIISRAAGLSLPSVIANGDTKSLLQIAQSLSPGAVSLLSPTALSQFTQAYNRLTAAGGTLPNAAVSDTTNFAGVFGAFSAADSNWNVCSRGDTATTDLSTLTGAGSDFSSMISNAVKTLPADDPQQNYALAALYGSTDVTSAITAQFPNVVQSQSSSSVMKTGTQDPQTGGILDKLASFMPGLSFAKGGAEAQQAIDNTNAYYAQLQALGVTQLTPAQNEAAAAAARGGVTTASSSTSQQALLAQTTITSNGVNVVTPQLYNALGQPVVPGTHTLLGYTQDGKAIYADDGYVVKEPLFPTP